MMNRVVKALKQNTWLGWDQSFRVSSRRERLWIGVGYIKPGTDSADFPFRNSVPSPRANTMDLATDLIDGYGPQISA